MSNPEHSVMDQDRTKNHRSTTLVVYPDAARSVMRCFVGIPGISSRTSRSSRIDLGIYSSTLSQRKTWVFPIHFRKGTSNKFSLTEFTVYTDSSFAPAGKQSQTGIAIFLTYGTVRHLIHWQSGKEKKMAESSAESELYALSTGHKVGRILG